MWFEKGFVFRPMRYPDGDWSFENADLAPGWFRPELEEVWLRTGDGIRLHGWYARRGGGGARGCLLWFHGNAGNISHRYRYMTMFTHRLPVDVLMVDYRGYGKSEGRPSEAGIYEDARTGWDYLTVHRGLTPDRILLLGTSLGGVPAIDLAQSVRAAGLIVQCGFTSIPAMARHLYPIPFALLPSSWIRHRMDSLSKMPQVNCPTLIVHGTEDTLVPPAMARAMYEAAGSKAKQLVMLEGVGHDDLYEAGYVYQQALAEFVDSHLPAAPWGSDQD